MSSSHVDGLTAHRELRLGGIRRAVSDGRRERLGQSLVAREVQSAGRLVRGYPARVIAETSRAASRPAQDLRQGC